jgi:hypothetical protein
MDTTEAHVTELKEKDPSPQPQPNSGATVGIPVTLTILVHVSAPVPKSMEENTIGELYGDKVVDVEADPDALKAAMTAAGKSPSYAEAINLLHFAAAKQKERHPNSRAFITPFAGVLPEEEI